MFGTLEWSDLRSARSGGRTLSNTVRLALIVGAFSAGLVGGELVQEAVEWLLYFSNPE